jgi:coenzyme F420-reducing hydrogenase delta subunit
MHGSLPIWSNPAAWIHRRADAFCAFSRIIGKIVAFLCNWCSYAGADLAGVSRLQYPPSVRVIRVMCSSRVNPIFIVKALQSADGVLLSGCHPGGCHYISGNYLARRRFVLLKKFLEYLGIEPKRLVLSWFFASEGKKFSEVVEDMVKSLG